VTLVLQDVRDRGADPPAPHDDDVHALPSDRISA
jgi:hypothetical protein